MKKSYLIQKLREAIRMQILKDKPLMEAEKIATGREESEEEDQELDQTVVGKPEEKEKQIGPDTEVGNIQNVAPPAAGTVTTVNPPSTKIEPTSPPAPVSADATVDKSKETDTKVSPGDDITKPDGVDTTGKVEPNKPPAGPETDIKGVEATSDIGKLATRLYDKGYRFVVSSESEIKDLLHNASSVNIKGDNVKRIGSKFITIIFRKRSDNKWRVLSGQIGSINKSFTNDKNKLMGTPVRDIAGEKVTDANGKPVIKYPGEWGAKYGLKSSNLSDYNLIPIYTSNVKQDPNLKNAAGESKPKASKWRSVPLDRVKGVIVGKKVYWKK